MSEQHTLYRFKDQRGRLLYVGITSNPGARVKQHEADKPWWSDVASMEMEHYHSREELAAAEQAAIVSERPLWNIVHDATTLDDHLAFYFNAIPHAWGRIIIRLDRADIDKSLLAEIDRVISDHRGVIPVDINVMDDRCRMDRYVTDRRTSVRAVRPLRSLLDDFAVNLA